MSIATKIEAVKRSVSGWHPIRKIEAKTSDPRSALLRNTSLWILATLGTTILPLLVLATPGSLHVGELLLYFLVSAATSVAGRLGLGVLFSAAERERGKDSKIASQAEQITHLQQGNGTGMIEQEIVSKRRELQFARIRQGLIDQHIERIRFFLGEKLDSLSYWSQRMEELGAESTLVGSQVSTLDKEVRARAVATISVNPKTDLLRRLKNDMGDLEEELLYLREYIEDYSTLQSVCGQDKIGYVNEELFYLQERVRVREEEKNDLEAVSQRVSKQGLDPSNYEFVRCLGIGGMGVALLFYSVAQKRFEVVKVNIGDCEPEVLERFVEREAKSLISIQHDNVARIYGNGNEDRDSKDTETDVLSTTFVSRALRETENRIRRSVERSTIQDVLSELGDLFIDTEKSILEFKPGIKEEDIKRCCALLPLLRVNNLSTNLMRALRGEWNPFSPVHKKDQVDQIRYRLYQKDQRREYDFHYYFMEYIRGGDLEGEIQALIDKKIQMSSWRVYSYFWQVLSAIECYSKRMVTQYAFLALGTSGKKWWALLAEARAIRVFTTRHGEENAIINMEIEAIKLVIEKIVRDNPDLSNSKAKIVDIFDNLPPIIIHRDLKPENLLPRRDIGEIKVIDFGIARIKQADIASDATRLTREGQVLVTQYYASLEQMLGEEIDITTDLYALAVIGYELLTRNLLFPENVYAQSLAARLDDQKIRANVVGAFQYRLVMDAVSVDGRIVDQAYHKLISNFEQMMLRMLAAYRKKGDDLRRVQRVDRPTIDEVKAVLEPLMNYAMWKAGRRATPD